MTLYNIIALIKSQLHPQFKWSRNRTIANSGPAVLPIPTNVNNYYKDARAL